jgi:hypothetical protein
MTFMDNKTHTNYSLNLHQRDVRMLNDVRQGTTLICENGTCWLTRPGDPRDIILLPGQCIVVDSDKKLLLEAMSDVRLEIIYSN